MLASPVPAKVRQLEWLALLVSAAPHTWRRCTPGPATPPTDAPLGRSRARRRRGRPGAGEQRCAWPLDQRRGAAGQWAGLTCVLAGKPLSSYRALTPCFGILFDLGGVHPAPDDRRERQKAKPREKMSRAGASGDAGAAAAERERASALAQDLEHAQATVGWLRTTAGAQLSECSLAVAQTTMAA